MHWQTKLRIVVAVVIVAVMFSSNIHRSNMMQQRLNTQEMQLTAELERSKHLQTQLDVLNGQLNVERTNVSELTTKLNTATDKLKQNETASTSQATSAGEQTGPIIRIDSQIPADAVAFLFAFIDIVHQQPKPEAKVWDDYLADSSRLRWLIEAVRKQPDLTYTELQYKGETTYKKPGKTNVIIGVYGVNGDRTDAYALSNINGAGWKITDVD
ncbi:hypothetical protein [Paenibacillus sp. OV219]|uniref:hypothetical protein n=1 Tax=Paenibacillus sp. OV219 TaxID=1884377 RepID=UPI0008B486A9|nr:hypothetical protein [Paenibacillus sp. OV219]SEM71294.1 hypothetical protein SAMN05518847_101588 [Paenibacillus sp. OV219]